MDYVAEARSRLMTPEEVARALKVHASTVYRLIRAGEIEVIRIGRLVRVRPAAVEKFIEKSRGEQR